MVLFVCTIGSNDNPLCRKLQIATAIANGIDSVLVSLHCAQNSKFALGKAECYLNCCKCNLHSHPCNYIVMTYLH